MPQKIFFKQNSKNKKFNKRSKNVLFSIYKKLFFILTIRIRTSKSDLEIRRPDPQHCLSQNYNCCKCLPSKMFSSKSFSMYGTNLTRRSVARMCRAAMSNSLRRWATSWGQMVRRESIPFTIRLEWLLTCSW